MIRSLLILFLLVGLAAGCGPEQNKKFEKTPDQTVNVLSLMKKRIVVDSSKILFNERSPPKISRRLDRASQRMEGGRGRLACGP